MRHLLGWAILFLFGFLVGAVVTVFERRAGATASSDAVSVGNGVRFICQTSAPSPAGRARLWARCSDGALVYTAATNTDYTVKP